MGNHDLTMKGTCKSVLFQFSSALRKWESGNELDDFSFCFGQL